MTYPYWVIRCDDGQYHAGLYEFEPRDFRIRYDNRVWALVDLIRLRIHNAHTFRLVRVTRKGARG